MNKLKVIFFGTPDFVLPVLESIHTNFELVGVVTTPDALVGRKQILTPSPIAQKAEELGIEVIKPKQFDSSTIEQLNNLSPDLFIVASYGKIIPQNILDIPKHGSINIHPSRLPLYRGVSPIQSQILDGVVDSGISFILMDAEMDHGSLIYNSEFIIRNSDTFQSLHYSMFKQSAEELPKVIKGFVDGSLKPIEQDHSKATFCGHITRESGYFDIENPPSKEHLDRMIRAYFPWPSAWTRWNGKIVKFLPEGKMQMEGKNPVSKKEFLNGFKDFPLEIF
jgi:methionyl-tRNA formyltransferase